MLHPAGTSHRWKDSVAAGIAMPRLAMTDSQRMLASECQVRQTCRARRGAPQDETLRLGECDVAAVCQGRYAKASAIAHILVVVVDLCITYAHLHATQQRDIRLEQVQLTSTSPTGLACVTLSRATHLAFLGLGVLRVAQL